ncbi:MAG: DUF4249 domain-containing protein [Chitinophagaceae bacterium]|nr:DUF4249 domain-containing protein [Chitinophagaceae bacterium]
MNKLIPILTFCILLISCERKVDFKLDDVTSKLVVEATIENGQPPVVYLTKSQAYFSQIDLSALANSFVRNAEVYVSNGTLTHKLKEYIIPAGGGLNFYYYSIDSANLATAFTGELNKQYSLRIIAEGKEYNAITTIPAITKRIDSLYWKQAPGSNPPEKVAVMIKATDPPGLGDYARYFTKRNQEIFYPGLNSVFDDQIIDGSTYDIQVERGVERNGDIPEGYSFFDKGDTVTLKLCNIDKATYDFWRTMEFTYASVGNPFASPTKVSSNISNGGLGYFGGYAAQYRTIIIPR